LVEDFEEANWSVEFNIELIGSEDFEDTSWCECKDDFIKVDTFSDLEGIDC
jgi:hypothetical protein